MSGESHCCINIAYNHMVSCYGNSVSWFKYWPHEIEGKSLLIIHLCSHGYTDQKEANVIAHLLVPKV